MRLRNKTALITGAGNGIGRESALLFANEGAKVVIVDRNEELAQKTSEEIHSAGGQAAFICVDVSQAEGCHTMIKYTESRFGELHILFNNAGILESADGNAQQTSEETWDQTMAINVKSIFLGCKYGIPLIKKSGGGSIINTASFVAYLGAATPQVAYTASKGAVLALTRELAVIHAQENIRVNALCPGPLRTELLMKVLDTKQKRQRRLVHIPMGRFGEAVEIARAALFLASDDSSFMTGSDLKVDGGITSAYVTPE